MIMRVAVRQATAAGQGSSIPLVATRAPDGGIELCCTGVDWQEGDVLDPVSRVRSQSNPGRVHFTPGVFLLSGSVIQ